MLWVRYDCCIVKVNKEKWLISRWIQITGSNILDNQSRIIVDREKGVFENGVINIDIIDSEIMSII